MKKLIVLASVCLVMASFQNCKQSDEISTHQRTEFLRTDANGHPYEGKVYTHEVSCGDGTLVESRIVKNDDGSGLLYRDNCQTMDPKKLESIELKPMGKSAFEFRGKRYNLEKPAIPLPGLVSWVYQLTGSINSYLEIPTIYIVDMFDTDPASIRSMKEAGHTVICSVSAGISEDWRPDYSEFQSADMGNTVRGSGRSEHWLNIQSTNIRRIMLSRLDLAKQKSCDGVNFDGVDGYDNNTGFSLTRMHQLEYNQFLAFAAHDRKLIMALNNVPNLAVELSMVFDFAIAEQCFEFNECDKYNSFVQMQKPVLVAEYTSYSQNQCDRALDNKWSLVFLNEELDGSRVEFCH